ncbi:LacI family DNA-binding transcriptional regulator [Gelidibacter maritimus]|uniref:LacI family DNA-binding transcriptional regulator n=1 Tax=Gelidibacter maritimus TaxID=2761487 RepID=A0A7W2R3G2_9FLAO|nr:LacI family DNA-binding transcriptional regulator [Gelidibacter maritimus]MBA6152816.1 LacI family DNA-binding transcriptional regulator [Gelidibacter maritimus]
MHPEAITLKKISRLSGYSVSTVSKALNDKKDISIETRATILNIAKAHNYVPNYYAIALRKQQTKTLALIIPQTSDEFYGQLLSEIQNMTFDLGYRLLVFQSFESIQKEKDCFKIINDGSVNGVLIITTLNNECLIKKLEVENMLPTVLWTLEGEIVDNNLILEETKIYFNQLLDKIF